VISTIGLNDQHSSYQNDDPFNGIKVNKERWHCFLVICMSVRPYLRSSSGILAPCDFWAFPTLKAQLRGKMFSSDDEVENGTAAALKGMSQNNLFHVFESFIKRCKNVFNVKAATLKKIKL